MSAYRETLLEVRVEGQCGARSWHTTCPDCGAGQEPAVGNLPRRHSSERVLHPRHVDQDEVLELERNGARYY